MSASMTSCLGDKLLVKYKVSGNFHLEHTKRYYPVNATYDRPIYIHTYPHISFHIYLSRD